ncbi:hypothetical protein PCASD_03722 [Puccinia coronata f. sp. avenae]|uniref:Uncharacterized protein n=1 Tax=Puccinia coronata f. sp. avenae TaxID=200324 RepID=A0A2N5V892_9BASI|nr:hypothetical protein PCASD_03722 [Puccinia coronata f. sp. avenae]
MSESMSDSKDGSRQQSQNESPQVSVGNADLSSLSPPTASAGWRGTQRNTRDGQNGCSTCNHRAASRNSGGAMGNQGVQRRGNEEIVAPSTVQIPNGMAENISTTRQEAGSLDNIPTNHQEGGSALNGNCHQQQEDTGAPQPPWSLIFSPVLHSLEPVDEVYI